MEQVVEVATDARPAGVATGLRHAPQPVRAAFAQQSLRAAIYANERCAATGERDMQVALARHSAVTFSNQSSR